MIFRVHLALIVAIGLTGTSFAQLDLTGVEIPELPGFRALPASDEAFSTQIQALVEESNLDEMTPAAENEDEEDEWSSVCVIDLRDLAHPVVGEWMGHNFLYPASTYKLYAVGEAVRQVCAGEISLEQRVTVTERNARSGDHVGASEEITVSEVMRLICQFSDNTAANVLIDLVKRERASALLRAMGIEGSDLTRKFLPRSREDEGYAEVASTVSNARHFATFLWAAETGAIGGGRGRGLIRGYLAMNETQTDRMRAGLPETATLLSKSGWWENFNSEAAIVEDGATRYIAVVMTAMEEDAADTRIADFTRRLHALMSSPEHN